ncbi:hydroxyethylthiazole kinase [Aeromicrobium phragmitis]|uniref:Hydroxyethylthiazole kinase n=1 Tax=Aeromicrobium phragmitis TaxID=2478914 RepID=A0A3L8PNI9_9ACTN|nr:hydroxyethylthiazole kinase [Aeromicrobium phragmitis]RLV56901.1 hydroxyethylthiazole kinase [Aeromicrobium phragmitis]
MSARIRVDAVIDTVRRLHEQSPLVQCITNYVSMDLAANLLNAAHASPAMVHDEREAAEMAGLASAVVVNIGTLSPHWVTGMHEAARVAAERGIPWVLDPVAVGATAYRRATANDLLTHRPTVIRANASEIVALATAQGAGRGADSTHDSTAVIDQAKALAATTGSVVVVSGVSDVVTDGTATVIVDGGDPRMPLISALGCGATALVAAAAAVADTPITGAVTAMAMLADAGERAGRSAHGPGTLRPALLDALWTQRPEDLSRVVLR